MNHVLPLRIREACAFVMLTLIAAVAPVAAQTAPASPAPETSSAPSAAASAAPAPSTQRAPERSGAPAPAATPASALTIPGLPGLGFSGLIRAYDFNRQNIPQFHGNNPNRIAFNLGGDVRAEYKLPDLPLTLGAAYWAADPLGLNGNNTLLKNTTRNGGIDNTLPGFPLSTFEYYVRYSGKSISATIGNQLINRLWAPSSDSRIKPALYQGIDATGKISSQFSVGVTRAIRFESRTDSLFDRNTLLTSTPAGASGLKTVQTSGLLRLAVTYAAPDKRLTGTAEANAFYDIGNLYYAEAKYNVQPANAFKPYIAAQYARETQTGRRLLGTISNETFGVQLGITPVKGFLVTAGADEAPWNYATYSASSLKAATSYAAANYFLPSGGTNTYLQANPLVPTATVQSLGAGMYRVGYGGIASPYTDSYATDPFYTTSLTQGTVDRRSPGVSFKLALAYTTADKRIVLGTSEALYNYDSAYARNRTSEFDADLTYNFNPVGAGTYKGLSYRERYGQRSQPVFPTFPQTFKYLRHQLLYSF